MAREGRSLPHGLAEGAQRFERWRRTRTKRRIPEALWDLARTLGSEYGVNRTAQALRLDYYDLKQRVEAGGQEQAGALPASSFLEVVASGPVAVRDWVVELEDARGVKMTMQLPGATVSDLVVLGQLLFGQRS